MVVPNLKHLPALSDLTKEATRFHWHKTVARFIYNPGPDYQKQKREEAEIRCDAPYRAWRDRPPNSKDISPHVYCALQRTSILEGLSEILNEQLTRHLRILLQPFAS
jgi:hypothetical protein